MPPSYQAYVTFNVATTITRLVLTVGIAGIMASFVLLPKAASAGLPRFAQTVGLVVHLYAGSEPADPVTMMDGKDGGGAAYDMAVQVPPGTRPLNFGSLQPACSKNTFSILLIFLSGR